MSSTENVLNMRDGVSATYQTLVDEIEVMGGETGGGNDSGTAAPPSDEEGEEDSDEDVPIPEDGDSGTAG